MTLPNDSEFGLSRHGVVWLTWLTVYGLWFRIFYNPEGRITPSDSRVEHRSCADGSLVRPFLSLV